MNAYYRPGTAAYSFRQLECKENRGALIEYALRPDPAAVLINDALDDRQADTGALELVLAVKAPS